MAPKKNKNNNTIVFPVPVPNATGRPGLEHQGETIGRTRSTGTPKTAVVTVLKRKAKGQFKGVLHVVARVGKHAAPLAVVVDQAKVVAHFGRGVTFGKGTVGGGVDAGVIKHGAVVPVVRVAVAKDVAVGGGHAIVVPEHRDFLHFKGNAEPKRTATGT